MRSALNRSQEQTFASLERGLTVSLIATEREDLATCAAEMNANEALSSPEYEDFDFVPVINGGEIVGLLNCERLRRPGEFRRDDPDSLEVSHVMEPLSEINLMSADAGILTFIGNAGKTSCRLLVSGSRVSGIVTLSDLQKLPVRPVLFLLITHLELLMAEYLRECCPERDAWLAALSPGRQTMVEKTWKSQRDQGLEIDKLTATQFCDKRDALIKLGDWDGSKGHAQGEFEQIESLRNRLAHAGDYAATRKFAQQTVETVRMTQNWIDRIHGAMARGDLQS